MIYLVVFAVPALFVLVMGLLDWRFRPGTWQDLICDLGWDSHVLAWGALGGVFTNSNINASFESQNQVVIAALICVGLLLILAICLLGLLPPRYQPQVAWKAVLALTLGGFALAVPGTIAYRAHM
ncbi:MAG: hypothetical protein Q7S58_14700 [Candidatus Binatus sp.]|uniref:hypothetical protein n=1 Tax=Candidatus Binatus sp. TaxID=2811406 RepID=UPI00271A0ED8|nr:hypothetical protein [Candidatus Binatus sp.]MDO8433652.1 hypothetical protein [Candidatus Binatus sp.]